MAQRPWVTPDEVRDYTENPTVQARSETRLAFDVARAEAYVIRYCGQEFESGLLPDNVRMAVILIAEQYAARAAAEATGASLLKSETNDDYSYTAKDTEASLADLNLGWLLDPYVKTPVRNGIRMDMHIC